MGVCRPHSGRIHRRPAEASKSTARHLCVTIALGGGRAMWRYGFLAVVLVAILALIPAAPSLSGPAVQPKRGGTLTIGISADAATLNPFVFRFNVERNALHMTHETLLNYDLKTFDLIYTGALESVQAAPNGLSYTFRLWANLKFHDGSPATAEDLKWSLEKAAQPTSG